MAKTVWDLKRWEVVISKTYGEVFFVGFYADGLECEIELLGSCKRKAVPTSDLIIELPNTILMAPLLK